MKHDKVTLEARMVRTYVAFRSQARKRNMRHMVAHSAHMANNSILQIATLTILNTTFVSVQLASGLIPGMMEKRSLSEMMMKIVVDHAPIKRRKMQNKNHVLAMRLKACEDRMRPRSKAKGTANSSSGDY